MHALQFVVSVTRARADVGRSAVVAATLFAVLAGCKGGGATPHHRERAVDRDSECRDAAKPAAFFYPAENRTDYKPDDPYRDGCD
ncbi:MAG TPA: hypothetical protein VL400_17450, partial [Polyangiaceae bacterium]|nr:hypothetical protein [Polyangiaceae bacterium]